MAARRSASDMDATSDCRSLMRSFIRSSLQQWKRAVACMLVGMAIPILYISHCFLNDDHWSGELPADMVGAFNLRVGVWLCCDGGGCAV